MTCEASTGVRPSASSASRTSASGPIAMISAPSPPSLSRRSSTTRCATFLPTPGTTVSASASPATTAATERGRGERRQERQRDLRADAGHAGEQIEQLALVGRGEPVQGHRVLADDHPRVDPRASARRRAGRRAPTSGRSVRSRPRATSSTTRPTAFVDDLPIEERDHRTPARAATPRIRAAKQMRQRDGDGVGGVGLRGNVPQAVDPGERRAAPGACRRCRHPVTACFTSFGAYSSTGRPASAATSMSAPVARATCSALTWLRLQATRSIATACGAWASIATRIPSASVRRRTASSTSGCVVTVPLHRRVGRPVAPAEDGEAAPRDAGVHPEHDRIEHLFAGV